MYKLGTWHLANLLLAGYKTQHLYNLFDSKAERIVLSHNYAYTPEAKPHRMQGRRADVFILDEITCTAGLCRT